MEEGRMSALTQKTSGRIALVFIALAMAAALAVLMPASDAPAGAEEPQPVILRDGIVLLSTEPGNTWVRFYADPDPSTPEFETADFDIDVPTEEQPIVVDRCEISSTDTILELTPSPEQLGLGLVDNGIGTREKNNCSTGNGLIELMHDVTIKPGSLLAADYGFLGAELDIEGKGNADLGYDLDGTVQTPLSLVPRSDNGPDSFLGDNSIAEISPESGFSTLKIYPSSTDSNAAIALEGGGDKRADELHLCSGTTVAEDGTITPDCLRDALGVSQSLFTTGKVYDGVLDCEEFAEPTSIDPDGPASGAVVQRALNIKDVDCTLIGYTFRILEDSVLFDFEDDGQGARHLIRIDFKPPSDIIEPRIVKIDYFDDGRDDYIDGVACSGASLLDGGSATSIVDGTNPLIDGLTFPTIDYLYEHPESTGSTGANPIQSGTDPVTGNPTYFDAGTEVPACVVAQYLQLTPDGTEQVQYWDLIADPKWSI
jgi:hypothetical protein